jgi:hypothetical protein
MSLYRVKTSLTGPGRVPARIRRAQGEFPAEAAAELRKTLVEAAPYPHIAATAFARPHGDTITAGYSAVDARAQDEGALILPKAGQALRFRDGSFRPRARLHAKRFFRRALAQRDPAVRRAFGKSHGRPGPA